MERDYRNRAEEDEARIAGTDTGGENAARPSNDARQIPRGEARNHLKRILTERAEVFRKLAR